MRTGTPGFVGKRLTEAREARGLSGSRLSDLLGVSRQAVSKYEKGTSTPSPDVLAKLSSILSIPEHFFWRPSAEFKSTIFYRSMSAATKSARLRAERKYAWLREICVYLEDSVDFPSVNFPSVSSPDYLKLTATDIEQIAEDARSFLRVGDGPVRDLVALLESHGGIVSRIALQADTLDAFSAWDDEIGRPFFVLGSDKASAARSRLDAAHELGHVLLHRSVDRRALSHTSDFKRIEEQAFRFAAALLLPAESFSFDFFVPTLDAMKQLKVKWRVSIAMMIHRCQDLNLISEQEARRLWIARSRRGWTKKEPLDDEIEPERPRLLRQSVELLIEQGVQTPGELLWNLPFAPADVEELAGLIPGCVTREALSKQIVELRQSMKRKGYSNRSKRRAQVVSFSRDPVRDED